MTCCLPKVDYDIQVTAGSKYMYSLGYASDGPGAGSEVSVVCNKIKFFKGGLFFVCRKRPNNTVLCMMFSLFLLDIDFLNDIIHQ